MPRIKDMLEISEFRQLSIYWFNFQTQIFHFRVKGREYFTVRDKKYSLKKGLLYSNLLFHV